MKGYAEPAKQQYWEGEADHRDQYFSDEERASQQSMLICCSRAKGKRLVLDL